RWRRCRRSGFVAYMGLLKALCRLFEASIVSERRMDIRVEGPVVQAGMVEMSVLAMVNELYVGRIRSPEVLAEGERRLQAKIQLLKEYDASQQPHDPPFLVSDFGTRRRYSCEWQKHVGEEFNKAAPHVFRGTSNVLLAKELG